ncbi:MAG: hypothetical protein CMF42_02945 [Legionellales bacterium]|nr:hypothetical protein [Legionellales bacterium]OUX67729.1 MAG: hypothetical protein CBD38_01810 [bacterium TMED178]|tara:strand:- start:16703 stop:17839 length:1137 start_codon:yes stop_codon:yes gene_type:complete
MRGQQQQQPNSGLDIVYVVGFIMVMGIVLWYAYGNIIAEYILYVRYYEAEAIIAILTPIDNVLNALHLPIFELDSLRFALDEIMSTNTNERNFEGIVEISKLIGDYLVFPTTLIAVLAGMHLLFFKKGGNFRQKYSMETLRSLECVNWPEIMPVIKTDLIKADIDDPPWGMSIQPIEFAKKYNLLKRVVVNHKPGVEVVRERSFAVFASQLGPRWRNLKYLKPHELAIFAVCAARIGGDADGSRKFLQQMSSSAMNGNPNFTGAYALMKKHITHKAVSKAVSPHAYVLTVLSSLLEVARINGVLASSEFLWLKKVDRRMWYMLSSVGRQTPFPEVAGTFAHWVVEKKLRRPLRSPMVEEAITGLEAAIADILYNPDET